MNSIERGAFDRVWENVRGLGERRRGSRQIEREKERVKVRFLVSKSIKIKVVDFDRVTEHQRMLENNIFLVPEASFYGFSPRAAM